MQLNHPDLVYKYPTHHVPPVKIPTPCTFLYVICNVNQAGSTFARCAGPPWGPKRTIKIFKYTYITKLRSWYKTSQ